MRKMTKQIKVGQHLIGGGSPIVIQSMCNTDTKDVKKTLEQIMALDKAGCQITRLAVVDMEAAQAFSKIREQSPIPIVADIHFDYRLALAAVDAGADKIRINPGNIGSSDKIKKVADACRAKNIPIRIGINSGSIEKSLLEEFGGPTPEAMLKSALSHIECLNRFDFDDICLSLKSASVQKTMEANILVSQHVNYPLHLGVTEAGTEHMGSIKSAAGIGGLLGMGIGDTIRVSLTADPVKEIYIARDILKAVGLSNAGIDIISCPTCGRCKVNILDIASQVEKACIGIEKKLTVAIMGCAVNGPGEAREADIGIAGGDGEVLLFKKGQIIEKIPQDQAVERLLKEIIEF